MMDRIRSAAEPVFDRLSAASRTVTPLLVRIVMGHAFVLAGWGKWNNLERTAAFFADVGIPFAGLQAVFVATVELVCGLLLIAGLATRLNAALLAATMVVALLTADRTSLLASIGSGTPTEVKPLMFLLLLLGLMAWGGGALSADRYHARVREKRATAVEGVA